MVGYLLSLSKVKIRISTASNVRKRSLEFRNSKKQRPECASFRIGRWKAWRKKLKYKGDWFKKCKGDNDVGGYSDRNGDFSSWGELCRRFLATRHGIQFQQLWR